MDRLEQFTFGKACEWTSATNDKVIAVDAKIAAEKLWRDTDLFREVLNFNHPAIIETLRISHQRPQKGLNLSIIILKILFIVMKQRLN